MAAHEKTPLHLRFDLSLDHLIGEYELVRTGRLEEAYAILPNLLPYERTTLLRAIVPSLLNDAWTEGSCDEASSAEAAR